MNEKKTTILLPEISASAMTRQRVVIYGVRGGEKRKVRCRLWSVGWCPTLMVGRVGRVASRRGEASYAVALAARGVGASVRP